MRVFEASNGELTLSKDAEKVLFVKAQQFFLNEFICPTEPLVCTPKNRKYRMKVYLPKKFVNVHMDQNPHLKGLVSAQPCSRWEPGAALFSPTKTESSTRS
jgi:hypothetical protein